jgi:uncharacterized protein YaiL (DUF2058 family)
MSDDPTKAALDEIDPGEVQAVIAKLKEENAKLSNSVSKLEGKRTEALDETKRLKRINKLLNAVGISHDDEDAESLLAEKLLNVKAEVSAAETTADEQESENKAPGPDPLMEAEMKRLKKQMEKLQEQNRVAEEEKSQAIAKNRADRIERIVVDALQKAGAANPSHAFRLMALDSKYRVDLTEEGTVVGGPDYDPKPLSDVVNAFRDDDSFSYMFQATGTTGAGTGSRSTAASHGSAVNPFRTDHLNVTQAAMIIQKNPDKAKRLMAEARSVGKLDPKFALMAK